MNKPNGRDPHHNDNATDKVRSELCIDCGSTFGIGTRQERADALRAHLNTCTKALAHARRLREHE